MANTRIPAIFAVLVLAAGCDGAQVQTSESLRSEASLSLPPTITRFAPRVAASGATVTLEGANFAPGLMLTFTGGAAETPVALTVQSSTLASFTVPAGATVGERGFRLSGASGSAPVSFNLVVASADGLPVISADASLICSDIQFYDRSGALRFGDRNCVSETAGPTTTAPAVAAAIATVPTTTMPAPAACAASGQIGCLAVAAFPAVDLQGLAAKIVSGQTVAGVAGTAVVTAAGALPDCVGGDFDCSVRTPKRAIDPANLTAPNIRAGVVIGGVTGAFPSSSNHLPGTSGATALTALTAATAAGSYEWWDASGVHHTGTVADAGTVAPGASAQTFNAGVYRGFSVAGDAGLAAGNIKSGTTIFGVAGQYPSASAPFADATATTDLISLSGTVAAGTYEFWDSTGARHTGTIADAGTVTASASAQTFNASLYRQFTVAGDADLVAGNIKSGINIFGVTGDFPSATYKLAGASATTDLTSLAGTVAAGSYEFWDAAGTRYTGTISDAATVTPGTSQQDFTTSLYRQFSVAGDANLLTSNIKNSVSIFGVTGAYPSTTNKLPGASATTDLTSLAAATAAGTYEFWGPDGTRYTGSIADAGAVTPSTSTQTFNTALYRQFTVGGSANLVAAKIKSGVSLFGVTGTYGAPCAGDGNTDCFVASPMKAADLTTISAWDLRKGKQIAGVTGSLKFCRNAAMLSIYDVNHPDGMNGLLNYASADFADTVDDYFNGVADFANGLRTDIAYCDGAPTMSSAALCAGNGTWIDFGGNTSCDQTNWDVLNISGQPVYTDLITKAAWGPATDSYGWDTLNGLQWPCGANGCSQTGGHVDSAAGGTYPAQSAMNWWDAAYACDVAVYGGHSDWRLPTQKELMQAYADSLSSVPSAGGAAFMGQGQSYWTATTSTTSGNTAAWLVDFREGAASTADKTTTAHVICVRN